MGSMLDVLKKLRDGENGVDAGQAPQADTVPTEDAVEIPHDADMPEDVGPAPSSRFAPGRPSEAASLPIDDATVTWDARKIDPAVVAFHERYAPICEQFRAVRTRLVALNSARARQIIVITSSVPEEGKSVSTTNIGLLMAEGGHQRTVIVDADFRRSSIAPLLGLRVKPGLADVIRGDVSLDEALQPTPLGNLKILTAGETRQKGYSELCGAMVAGDLLDQLRQRFDYTFIDTPPVTTVADVSMIAPQCDGAVVVIEMRRTPEPIVQQAVRTLQTNNVKILGALLSRFRDRRDNYYERYYSQYLGE